MLTACVKIVIPSLECKPNALINKVVILLSEEEYNNVKLHSLSFLLSQPNHLDIPHRESDVATEEVCLLFILNITVNLSPGHIEFCCSLEALILFCRFPDSIFFFLSFFFQDTEDDPGSPIGLKLKRSVGTAPCNVTIGPWLASFRPVMDVRARKVAKHQISVGVHVAIAKRDSNFWSA